MDDLIVANDLNFEQMLQDEKTIIVDFWSPTCAPCKQIEPGLKKIAQTYNSRVKILKVNVNDSPNTSSRFMVRGLPTILIIRDGNVKSQLTGSVHPREIELQLQRLM